MTIHQLSIFIENRSGTLCGLNHCRYGRVWYLPTHLFRTPSCLRGTEEWWCGCCPEQRLCPRVGRRAWPCCRCRADLLRGRHQHCLHVHLPASRQGYHGVPYGEFRGGPEGHYRKQTPLHRGARPVEAGVSAHPS